MAVWLTMNMSYVGAGDYANTSKVAVSVDVHWDYKHYNRDGGSLTVTVDGVPDTRSAPFNAGETSSGSQNIYSAYWNVSQPNGEAKTVYASATFQATSNTTATPASASLPLAAISGSGGDSGDDDDDPEEGGEGGGSGSGTTTSESGIIIANGSKFDGYRCHIDTYHAVTSDVGHTYDFDGTSMSVEFVAPSDSVEYDSVTVYFPTLWVDLAGGYFINFYLYLLDENNTRIAQTAVSYEAEGLLRDVRIKLTLDAPLQANTKYRINTAYDGDESESNISGTITRVYISGKTTSMVNEYLEYEAYIDNGTNWIPYT